MEMRQCFGGPLDGQERADLGTPLPENYRNPLLGEGPWGGRYERDDDLVINGERKRVWRWVPDQGVS